MNFGGVTLDIIGSSLFPLGDFVTCDVCHDLIERGDFTSLAERAGYDTSNGLPMTVTQFQIRRQGPALPYNQQ